MKPAPFIAFEKVQKLYGEGQGLVRALAGVDLAIARGERRRKLKTSA